ncbi:hypothetical protein PUNSTDRAFT_46162 [Punctularia strigosozonata HHB-11173 SS5]|uniref:uncharacterized protein n=1 Tax=Punctularia strigosozonata (strain HHB-11173) TaxID=741275 RepID=UPI00044172CE|nr:uncharacterized protein PUNSTDRAFT_46162 [Punctularia strigosozonata HHB-11173 SS5]EIN06768.1 hypothetical protein PUNSTDRAFT_46162 [Punctularia strigosozonata HHB-11173 SS5]
MVKSKPFNGIQPQILEDTSSDDPWDELPKIECPKNKQPHHHRKFYFANVVFQVEDVLFSVPRQTLERNSIVFRDMFENPVPEGTDAEGVGDDNPIRLEGIELNDFEQLLDVLFQSLPGQDPVLSCGQWVSVLKLSTMWQFDHIRSLAIRTLSVIPMEAVSKVVLAKTYNVEEWIVPSLNEIARRSEPIGVEDAAQLGLEWALKLAEVRESLVSTQINTNQRQYNCHICGEYQNIEQQSIKRSTYDFTQQIRRVFAMG